MEAEGDEEHGKWLSRNTAGGGKKIESREVSKCDIKRPPAL